MNDILFITGNIVHPITLDPGVWIFDDRKVDLRTYFQEPRTEQDELENYKKNVSKHWDREIKEGAAFPPVNKSISRFEKERIIVGTFGIPLRPFLENAVLGEDVTKVEIHTKDAIHTISIEEAKEAILGFSNEGKPLREDGPAHFYYGDGRNENAPILHLRKFVII